MITEDYVSFETAKLLKEKGFDENTPANYFVGDDKLRGCVVGEMIYHKREEEDTHLIACPTLQMAMKWLMEKHNLHIITLPYAPIDRNPYHPGEADVVYIAQLFKGIIPIDKIGRSIIKLTHEQACEAAIRYTLENLI